MATLGGAMYALVSESKFVLKLFTFLFLILCFPALASGALSLDLEVLNKAPVFTFDDRQGTQHWLVVEASSEAWQLLHYSAKKGEMQQLVDHRSFADKKTLQKHLGGFPVKASFQSYGFESMQPFSGVEPLFQTEDASEVLWATTHDWNEEWEQKYSQWVEENIDKDFFLRHQISTDCADVPFAVRWIFSRIHGLPVANRLAGSGRLITNESFKRNWARLKTHTDWHQDKRFLAALEYILDNTYTHSLYRDSYPVEIDQASFRAGSYLLELRRTSGHTKLVDQTDFTASGALPFTLLYSDVPQTIRALVEGDYWIKEVPERWQGGFMRFRWPEKRGGVWTLRSPEDMYGFSTEQFDKVLQSEDPYYETLLKRLKPYYDPVAKVKRGVHYISEQVKNRISVVREGYEYCRTHSCSKGSGAYLNWSTPSRDKRLRETIIEVEAYAQKMGEEAPKALQYWWQSQQEISFLILGEEMNLAEIIFIFRTRRYDSSPRSTPEERWGKAGFIGRN